MAFELIKKTTASTTSASLLFENIPQTYKDLKIFATIRSDISGSRGTAAIAFNSDTNTSNYKGYEWYYEDGAMGGEFNNNGTSASRNLGAVSGSSSDANQFGAMEIIIPNYANTTNYKVCYTSIAAPRNASTGYSYWDRGNTWLNNNAINTITLSINSNNILSGSTIWLYGLK
jgi:hypothetical protein